MEVKLNVAEGDFLPLREVVFNTLREAILTGDLHPGERLMEIQLAEQLGVSRTPVREAIRKLEIEGLAVMIPRKGAEVASITEKQLKDVLEVRKALEELAVEMACERISQEDIKELQRAHQEVKKLAGKKNLSGLVRADMAFHDVIYKAADNEQLIQILNKLRQQMYRYRMEYLKKFENHELIVAEHEVIFEAVCDRNSKAAIEAIRLHITNQEEGVLKTIAHEEKSE